MQNIARVARSNGVVVNIEAASDEWISANSADLDYAFIPYADGEAPSIGSIWDGSAFVLPDRKAL